MPGKVGQHKVHIIESEAGWGSKVDEVKYFDSHADALGYVFDYNKKYNPDIGKVGARTPDWYMIAQYAGVVE